MSLVDDVQEIRGIGPATAASVVEIVESHGSDHGELDVDELLDALRRAKHRATHDDSEVLLELIDWLGG